MERQTKDWNTTLDWLFNSWERLKPVMEGLIILYAVVQAGYKAYTAPADAEKWTLLVVVPIIVPLLYGWFRLVDFFFKTIQTSSDWLEGLLLRSPNLRRGIIIGFLVIYLIVIPIFTNSLPMHFLLKVFLFYLCWVIPPSAITAVMRAEKVWKMPFLEAARITPNLIAENHQAALENAFTHFEHRLRERLGCGAEVYGDRLINQAFGKDGQLTYGSGEGENNAVRNLMAGAYGTFRNPRKHRVIQDDVNTTYRILLLVELLTQIVDEATPQSAHTTA